ncbi:MAG: hypothetical protein MUO30_11395 [Anaerolineales bacterium]|nr:hypothetical protein [Anaerolineales bacterium]
MPFSATNALRFNKTQPSLASTNLVNRQGAGILQHPKEVQDDEDDGNHDQSVNPTAGLREAWAYVPTEKAKQPQDYENYDDRPQYEISPFE